jgi:hypothetical protein
MPKVTPINARELVKKLRKLWFEWPYVYENICLWWKIDIEFHSQIIDEKIFQDEL